MCGRVHLAAPFADIAIAMDILAGGAAPNIEADYNIAPTKRVVVVYLDPVTRRRVMEKMVWGLIPRWAKEPRMAYPTFNAKAETVDTLASFRAPWREGKRCLVVTEGFYEWKKGKKNPKNKQPYAIARAKSKFTVMAGLWERWRDAISGEVIHSCTVITTAASRDAFKLAVTCCFANHSAAPAMPTPTPVAKPPIRVPVSTQSFHSML